MKVFFKGLSKKDRTDLRKFLRVIPKKYVKRICSITFSNSSPLPYESHHIHALTLPDERTIELYCGKHPETNKRLHIWQIKFILMHEIGHVFHRHKRASKKAENEADLFASNMMREVLYY